MCLILHVIHRNGTKYIYKFDKSVYFIVVVNYNRKPVCQTGGMEFQKHEHLSCRGGGICVISAKQRLLYGYLYSSYVCFNCVT